MADLLLGLAAAVVKVACKVWLKDDEFASDASTEVVDAVRARVSGELDQRHARRLFEDLEVPVSKKLGVLRQHEFAGMPDNEWTAAVLAVGDTLREARFTDADIFEGDLDPLYLRRKILAGARGATRDLPEAGTALYHRLLTECCAYVVELTTTLPRFSAGAFAEILRRQSVIIQRVTEVLDRMPSSDAEADFAANYRRQVINQLDRLELFGVTVSESVRGYPLSTAYISLGVTSGGLRARDAGFPGTRLDQPTGTLRIDDVLARTSRLFLRGEAGSGKTTMLQWLAVRAARRDFPPQWLNWNDTVPFLVRLRRYANRDLPAPEEFVNEVGRHIAAEMPARSVHGLLRSGRALILVDGVDELPEAQRRPARDWLVYLVDTFPSSRYVITSRPGAADSNWLEGQGFDAAEVEPMTWPDIREFLRHWHAAFRDESADAERRDELATCERKLLDALFLRRHLRLLATNPLLCALLCALNLDRRTQLPDERMELYAIALDMMLERRDVERQIARGDPMLSKTSKMLLLEDLAYRLIRNGWSDAPKDRATEWIRQRLASMPKADANRAPAVLDGLIVRSGLIREPVAGRIDFVHRTFQEYLAAHAAVDDDQIGELIRNGHDDQWREVVIMAAGHAQPRQRDELLRSLLARADEDPKKREVLQTLAVACLETSPQLDPGLHARIQDVAESLLPPKNIRQAEVLARLGEPLLDLLAGRPILNARQAVATMRAASLISGPTALRIVASCAKIDTHSVADELMRAWPLFDPEDYARIVISGSPHRESFRIEDPALLPGLRHIKGLTNLVLEFKDGDGDLTVLRYVSDVRTLNLITDPKLRDLRPLTGHPRLEDVLLREVGMVDLGPLVTLPNLRRLSFWADRVTNIEAVRDCPKLEEISVYNLTVVAGLPQFFPPYPLKLLDVRKGTLEDLTALLDVAGLEALRLVDCHKLRSIQGIDRWAATMRSFMLVRSPRVTDLEPLATLKELRTLSVSSPSHRTLAIVRRLSGLRTLHLNYDVPVDLTPLRGVTGLSVYVTRGQQVHGGEVLGAGSHVIRV
ncbi:MAG: NACHT domain-containing protein [Streptosporangiaceae bacterium]|nr:NACHT domain-containing protein [Streptosporangiaceae bacterium]